ncbi:hypothetical protein QJS66_09445 [Kocuria rhizophila]|nr:hypothetical protein QJS66_09445 [Kocuria rhizophila]
MPQDAADAARPAARPDGAVRAESTPVADGVRCPASAAAAGTAGKSTASVDAADSGAAARTGDGAALIPVPGTQRTPRPGQHVLRNRLATPPTQRLGVVLPRLRRPVGSRRLRGSAGRRRALRPAGPRP